ncbi:Cap [Bat associated cyclovirus 17]|uniref:Cap n=1 Tax=Bat associated cyclovirus 17 TaxID=2911956 RepID=UPI002481F842|nr:Cap [Bat associated cyclovirus 17]UJO02082.1 Cap [Bat associated cyclovirus 17]
MPSPWSGRRRMRRRITRRPRRTIRRRSRRYPRRSFRRRRTGCFTVKATLLSAVTTSTTTAQSVVVAPTLQAFPELVDFADKFEYYQFSSVHVKVTPQTNVAYVSQSIPEYFSAPWHRPVAGTNVSTTNVATLDKHRKHPGTSKMSRKFVPAIMTVASINGTGATGSLEYQTMRYRPKIALGGTNAAAIEHFAGLLAWPTTSGPVTYNVDITVICKFYNQQKGLAQA